MAAWVCLPLYVCARTAIADVFDDLLDDDDIAALEVVWDKLKRTTAR